jgi:pyruvate dehydrogenase (quinone)
VSWEQRVSEGDPKFDASQDLPDFPYAAFADLAGLHGIRVDRPAQIGPAWDEALASTRPVVVDALTDPNVPPLPPHVSLDQARNFMRAIAHGDPDSPGILRKSIEVALQELVPH